MTSTNSNTKQSMRPPPPPPPPPSYRFDLLGDSSRWQTKNQHHNFNPHQSANLRYYSESNNSIPKMSNNHSHHHNHHYRQHPAQHHNHYYSNPNYPYHHTFSFHSSPYLNRSLNTLNNLSFATNQNHSTVKLQQLGNRLQSWKTISIGLSFLVLLLLLCKLHDVDREINYLHFISTEWLSQQTVNQQLLYGPSQSLSSSSKIPESSSSSIVNRHDDPDDDFNDNNVAVSHRRNYNDDDDDDDDDDTDADHHHHLTKIKDKNQRPSRSFDINDQDNLYTFYLNDSVANHSRNNLGQSINKSNNNHQGGNVVVLRDYNDEYGDDDNHRFTSTSFKRKRNPSDQSLFKSTLTESTDIKHLTKPTISSTASIVASQQLSQTDPFKLKHYRKKQLVSSASPSTASAMIADSIEQLPPLSLSSSASSPSTIASNKNDQSSDQQDVLELTRIITIITFLKEDVDVLMGELMASRTTLLLSLVFVLVYLLSWCWMAYAIRATNTPQDISLKTILLLAIFSAVDIAASAGFVMVRVIMYLMRDHYFPRDMRTPAFPIEYNQLAAYVGLRLTTMKSSTGVIDIFVSVIVSFLTLLRVYSVICAVSFYRRARKELIDVKNFELMIERPRYPSSQLSQQYASNNHHLDHHLHHHHSHHQNNSNPFSSQHHHHHYQQKQQQQQNHLRSSTTLNNGSNTNVKSSPNATSTGSNKIIESNDDLGQSGYLPKIRLLSAHKDLERKFSMNNNGRDQKLIDTGGANGIDKAVIDPNNIERSSSSTSSDDDPTNDLKIQAADMPTAIQKSAMQSTIHALRTYTTEKHIAESIKQNFDQLHEPTWHCIVGRNWGSCVTHTKSNYIRMLYKDLTILLYKSS
ncbi:FAS-associated factor 2-like [Sarcoptes scabiei]|nr:FAS-associated factor 2-like [Sarcoptes scabiei]